MSNFQISWDTGRTLNTYLVDAVDARYRFDTHVFEAFVAGHWTNYGGGGITEQAGTGEYFGTLPTTGIPAGTYAVTVRDRLGLTPDIADPVIASAVFDYDGSGTWSAPAATLAADLVVIGNQTADVQQRITDLQGSMNVALDGIAAIPAAVNASLTTAHGAGAWNLSGGGGGSGGTGTGDVLVTHNYGGTDSYRATDPDGNPLDGVNVYAYAADVYNTATVGVRPDAQTVTGSDGRWIAPLHLDPGDYKLVFSDPGERVDLVSDLTVTEPAP